MTENSNDKPQSRRTRERRQRPEEAQLAILVDRRAEQRRGEDRELDALLSSIHGNDWTHADVKAALRPFDFLCGHCGSFIPADQTCGCQ
jgi:hypothetical protein